MRILALWTAFSTVVGSTAWAQTEPKAPAPAAPDYQSSFVAYRGFKDEPVAAWRESNDAMQRLGGHMGHMNEATGKLDEKPAGRERRTEQKASEENKR